MIRILHVISDSNIGGAGHQLLNLLKGLSKDSFDIKVVVPHNAKLIKLLDEISIKHEEAPHLAEKSFSARAIWYLYKIIRDYKPDIVHTHAALSARIAARMYMRCKIINTRHCAFPVTSKQKKLKWVVRIAEWLLGGLTVAVSDSAKEKLIQQGVSDKKIVVVNNGIDISLFKYDEEKRIDTRKELGLSEDTFCVGHVGRFEPEKNHAFLLEVFDIIRKQKKSTLVLVGCGSFDEELKTQAEKLGIKNDVLFLGTCSDISRLYQAFDVFIMPSTAEGFGLAAVEAQCSGLGCILSEHFPKTVKCSDSTKFLPLGDAKQWALETLNQPKQNRKDGQVSVINSKLDIETMCKEMMEIYGLGVKSTFP